MTMPVTLPVALPKVERRRTVSFRKGHDPREELLRRSTTPDVKEVRSDPFTAILKCSSDLMRIFSFSSS